jgi:hypothetical protein
VTSRAFEHGVFPAKDSWVYEFDKRYLRDVEPVSPSAQDDPRVKRNDT